MKLFTPPRTYEQIVSFEPDGENYNICLKNHKKTSNIQIINAGVSNSDGELHFSGNSGSTSHISESGNRVIKVRAIDGLKLNRVTFIKMDIEGAEMEALQGAYKTILRDLPRLAICLYHSNEHMIQIPEWIYENFPQYKLYIRHHKDWTFAETVLYAVIDGKEYCKE